jgi:hypothetical protein
MSMDKLMQDLLNLMRDLLASQQRVLNLTLMRREAMRTYDLARLEALTLHEKHETATLAVLERRRQQVTAAIKAALPRHVEPTVSEMAKRATEPMKSQLLGLAAQIRQTVEQVERNTRINMTVSETVVKGLARVLKVVTGLAQHAGLYMRNGRKAAMHGIHLLEVTA